jgi:serine phosphatase RsbU (regulator of sigma subunit)
VVVWLSDGIIEAVNQQGEPFGYERAKEALRGPVESAASIRDHLLETVGQYTDRRPAQDDQTLVVMSYRPGGRIGANGADSLSLPPA